MEFVWEGPTVDALTSDSSSSWISSLDHEVFDDTMKDRTVIVTFETQLDEIPAGTRCLSSPKINLEGAIVCL